MQQDFIEKRRHPRLDLRIPMRYRKIETTAQEFKGSLIKNISEGGAQMMAYEFLPLNSRLSLEIPLVSGRKSLQGVCRVAWVKQAPFSEQFDVGIDFSGLNQEDGTQLNAFIKNKTE